MKFKVQISDMKKPDKEPLNIKGKKIVPPPLIDGTNRPVPSSNTQPLSESEAALFKQAENPLGDPHKV